MRLTTFKNWLAAAALAVALPAAAQVPADGAAAGAVTGIGTVTLKRTPDAMRVQVTLTAEGKTMKDALAKLQQRKDGAKKKLADLGAAAASIAMDDPQLAGADPRAQQMQRMMRNRGGNKPATAAAAPPVRVATLLKAEWPLSAKSAEELLLATQAIQDKVRAADLGGTKAASLEEQENREENAGMDMDEQGVSPGEPAFTFVGKVSPEDRAKAMAEAFAKAKAQAAELAKAAAADLGPVKQVVSQAAGQDYEQMAQMAYMYGRYRGGMTPNGNGDDAQNEAVGLQPTAVSLRIFVSASFALK